ncbi:hypothetical protein SAMN05661091_5381 [Paenibacillus uliginis N3/975]|uniref:Uncharacterized protein n=1 Tax=Paenibacillus uliginis N3/975 TaxID=1313296 RepID=A0A1X7HQT4_9BACL|nr:hypothetical protein [Paenibacillus uliginis]SMF91222.1 hypothetical protein SAMN05661091_5381 [Paenibacillus uliginis N3/975]
MISVDYGARWPIRFEPFPSDEVPELYDELIAFVGRQIVIGTWCGMDDVKRCKLIEKITIEFCKETSPKKTYGVGQAMVRGGIIEAIDIYGGGGTEWLSKYGSYRSNQSNITAESSPCEMKPAVSTRFNTARRSPRSSYASSRQ